MTGVGIIGCGVISDVYAKKMNELEFLDLVACADLMPDRAAKLAKDHQIPKTCTAEELIADPDVDVVVNLTIPAVHYEVSRAAVDAGKAVFSEKPLALTLEEGLALGEAAAAKGVRVGCAPDTFLGAGLQTCRKLIDDGAIGVPVAANGFMLSPGPESWHPGPQMFYQRGAGPLFDMGPSYLTAIVSLLGPARRVTGSVRITHEQRKIGSKPLRGQMMDVEVPTHVASVIDLESGPVATLVTSFDVQTTRLRNIQIYGTEGTLSLPDPNTFGGVIGLRRPGEKQWDEIELTHGNAQQSRGVGLGDMVRAIQSDRPHRASLELSSHVLELMQSIVTASDSGRHVELQTTCDRPAPLPPGLPDDTFD
jgi:predicted dehydrogenase